MDKREIRFEIMKFLSETPKCQFGSVRGHVHEIMRSRGEIGSITTGDQYMRTTREVSISDDDALFINEVIYDLVSERVITPGINAANLDWPFLHVSNPSKLETLLLEMKQK